VLNKIDQMPPEDVPVRCNDLLKELDWAGPVFPVSALRGDGLRELVFAIMEFLDERRGAEDAVTQPVSPG
jgi:GTPase